MNQIPNRFPVPEDQELGPQKRPPGFKLSDINWRGVAIIIALILGCVTAWIVIRDLSNIGGGFASVVTQWVKGASINPEDERGFTSFLKLLLTAGFIGSLLIFFRKK